ncbi:MAG: type III pantothenate kinase [Bacteroidales bacterium]|nr:type III pantothenate kinase [Bacteroidales bacterium]
MITKLALDFGNTLIKTGIFDDNQLFGIKQYDQINLNLLDSLISEIEATGRKIKFAIISSVIDYPDEIYTYMNNRFKTFKLNEELHLPYINEYQTTETLGNDRMALVAGALSKFPKCDILIIGAGTCITYDYVDNQGRYFGGAISPGIRMRYRALNTFTGKLPLITDVGEVELIGRTTGDSIRSGVINGAIAEVEGIIAKYQSTFNGLKIIITGGDMIYFEKKVKNNIFAIPNLVLIGLNEILETNIQK